ncbi:hypothetical protein AVEN_168068-1 [Araneus ventricosus]|uniref:Uncharacterized protein n=1 Tax=Araneus ventricosus TaxID=182803 RepID=A0A4Y2T8N6_ARAVE|nr:hypothetical protein AVEN_168068-1 [Araneus ventricosus]
MKLSLSSGLRDLHLGPDLVNKTEPVGLPLFFTAPSSRSFQNLPPFPSVFNSVLLWELSSVPFHHPLSFWDSTSKSLATAFGPRPLSQAAERAHFSLPIKSSSLLGAGSTPGLSSAAFNEGLPSRHLLCPLRGMVLLLATDLGDLQPHLFSDSRGSRTQHLEDCR